MTESESKLRQRSDGRLDRSRDPAILNAAVPSPSITCCSTEVDGL